MTVDHATLVAVAKTYGLLYFVALALGAILYAYWPTSRRRFDTAAQTILEDEDRPCR